MSITLTDSLIPAATCIDYADKEEICGYQFLLCKLYESEGGLGYPAVCNQVTREVERQGIVWLREVKAAVKNIFSRPLTDGVECRLLALGDIPDLMSSYDFFHRICYGKADSEFVRKTRVMTVDRWLKGDKSISKTAVVIELMCEVNRDIRALDDRYSTFAISTIGDWIKELMRFGKFRGTTLEETYQRLGFLLKDNLFAYLGSKEQLAVKARWIKQYTLPDSDIDTLDTPTLRAYIAFTHSAATLTRMDTLDGMDTQYTHLLSKLAPRTDLNPYQRQVLHLDLLSRRPLTQTPPHIFRTQSFFCQTK